MKAPETNGFRWYEHLRAAPGLRDISLPTFNRFLLMSGHVLFPQKSITFSSNSLPKVVTVFYLTKQ